MSAHHELPEKAQLSGRIIVTVRISEELREEIDLSIADFLIAYDEEQKNEPRLGKTA